MAKGSTSSVYLSAVWSDALRCEKYLREQAGAHAAAFSPVPSSIMELASHALAGVPIPSFVHVFAVEQDKDLREPPRAIARRLGWPEECGEAFAAFLYELKDWRGTRFVNVRRAGLYLPVSLTVPPVE